MKYKSNNDVLLTKSNERLSSRYKTPSDTKTNTIEFYSSKYYNNTVQSTRVKRKIKTINLDIAAIKIKKEQTNLINKYTDENKYCNSILLSSSRTEKNNNNYTNANHHQDKPPRSILKNPTRNANSTKNALMNKDMKIVCFSFSKKSNNKRKVQTKAEIDNKINPIMVSRPETDKVKEKCYCIIF